MTKILKLLTLSFLMLSLPALAVEVVANDPRFSIKTDKVAHIYDDVDMKTEFQFVIEMNATKQLPGPRLILINSNGGSVTIGERMLNLINEEQRNGVQVYCMVIGRAHSMAFNILTHCNVRLSTETSRMLVHKIRIAGATINTLTAKMLRRMADQLDKDDEPYRQANSSAMGLSLEDYDKFADAETFWTPNTLLNRGYLNSTAVLKKSN